MNRAIPQLRAGEQGFSLLQISMLLAIASVVLVSVLPGGELGSDPQKRALTLERMQKIEEATKAYMVQNLHRPCPADGTLAMTAANFGVAANTTGANVCGGTLAANFDAHTTGLTASASAGAFTLTVSDATDIEIGDYARVNTPSFPGNAYVTDISGTTITLNVPVGESFTGQSAVFYRTPAVGGVVPTKTLGLPDEYALDGYGRRFTYLVDVRAAGAASCRDLQNSDASGRVHIKQSASPSANVDDSVMWALISYGKDGHGAFPLQGSAVADRLNTGASDADTENNAFADEATMGDTSPFAGILVRKEPTSDFDDLVWTNEASKNTCCMGKMCNMGVRIDGDGAGDIGASIKTGDINGDGVTDFILPSPANQQIYVILGRKSGWPAYNAPIDVTDMEGTGFIIDNDTPLNFSAESIAVGNINGDSHLTLGFPIDDIVIGTGDATNSVVTVFLGGTSVDTAVTTLLTTSSITLPPSLSGNPPVLASGRFSAVGQSDIVTLVTYDSVRNSAVLLYGSAAYGTVDYSVTPPISTAGIKIDSATATNPFDTLASGNLNNDSLDELLIGAYSASTPSVYMVFGRDRATVWELGSNPLDIDGELVTGTTILFTGGTNLGRYTMQAADLNGDRVNDLLINSGNYYNAYFGKSSSWGTSTIDLTNSSNYDNTLPGVTGFRVDIATNAPGWLNTSTVAALAADVNNDGRLDLVFSDPAADPNSVNNSGSSFVALQPQGLEGWGDYTDTFTLFGNVFDTTDYVTTSASTGLRIDGGLANDGTALLGAADVNHDGKTDLLIGSSGSSAQGNRAYIMFGRRVAPWDIKTTFDTFN